VAEVNHNPGLDALWKYVRSLPPMKGEPMDDKVLAMAREAGFNIEHPATNEHLRRFAELVRNDCMNDMNRERVAETEKKRHDNS